MTDPQDRHDADAEASIPPDGVGVPAETADLPAALAGPATSDAPLPVEEGTTVVGGGATATRRRGPRRTQPVPVSPYAIIETGGKQYRVSVGDSLAVERLPLDAGGDVTIDRVLLLGGDGATRVGTPIVDGATVTARVDDHFRGEKIVVFKYKAKKRYRRRMGHRQSLTRLTITGIAG